MSRARDKKHLTYVASLGCCICKGHSVAHHLTIAEPNAWGMKDGDNWTVPLCPIHHSELHRLGDERLYWLLYEIDPFELAQRLWKESR